MSWPISKELVVKKLVVFALCALFAWTAGAQRNTATVSGYITDAESGETLLGAGVLVADGAKTPTGAVTNVYGYYQNLYQVQ